MKILLLAPEFDFNDEWQSAIRFALPDVELVDVNHDSTDEIEVALVYNPPARVLCHYTKLRIIITLSAGADGLLSDDSLPEVLIVRLAHQETISLMREYVVYQVLRLHRDFATVEKLNRDKEWQWQPSFSPGSQRNVSILGLGKFGKPCAIALSQMGFKVAGWSRTAKVIESVSCYSGDDGLLSMLHETDILICLLPLTMLTRNILSHKLFKELPSGASVINVSRGACLNEEDLLKGLNNGPISHATLDVFNTEPLPVSHPFWTHPKITITPHVAADARPRSSAHEIREILKKFNDGDELANVVDREKGY